MTDHPITPPPGLVQQWMAEVWHEGTPVRVAASDLHIATQAARWGADMELEACCEWADATGWEGAGDYSLRPARRPEPPSLKEQALGIIDDNIEDGPSHISFALEEIKTIRRALEQLDD